jgi:type II secretory pathway pseudopilin PulG
MKKAQIWISATLYTLIIVVAIVIVLTAVVPLINKMKDRAVFQKVKTDLLNLDAYILAVSSEGQGSQRIVPLEVQEGLLKTENGQVFWELQSEAKILEPRTSLNIGNLFLSSNADVNASVSGSIIRLENSRIAVEFNASATNISKMVAKMSISSANLPNLPGGMKFKIDGAEFPSVSSVELIPGQGTNFGRATVVVHTADPELDVEFTLEGGADFLITNVDID